MLGSKLTYLTISFIVHKIYYKTVVVLKTI